MAAIHSGGPGRWSGSGASRAARRRKTGPSVLTLSPRHSARTIASASPTAATRAAPARLSLALGGLALVSLAALLLAPLLAVAETPAEQARALVARYHEDPTTIERARDLLEAALARERQPDTLVTLSFVYFLIGE